MRLLLIVWLFCIGFGKVARAQELPPITSYTPQQYKAGNQNWMIGQDKHHFLYFANNQGLLEWNGATFTSYPLPNQTIVRSVMCVDDRIYTGAYMSFGYWKRQANGQLQYFSLSDKVQLLEDEQFWDIVPTEHWIVFQSLHRIYVYDTKTGSVSTLHAQQPMHRLFLTQDGLLFQNKQGLQEITNQTMRLHLPLTAIANDKIINITATQQHTFVFTQQKGIFLLQKGTLVPFKTAVDALLRDGEMYCVRLLSNDLIAIGTISKGLVIIDKQGKLIHHIKQQDGLNNNTVLSIFEDADRNIWLGLDNGISCINYQSPIRSFVDDSGFLGTVYASSLFNNYLYIGTNQGLFYKKYPSDEKWQFVAGTKGQVWSLFQHDNTLFCGHDKGTLLITLNEARPVFSESGTWKFQVINDMIMQGHYQGLSVWRKQHGSWQLSHRLSGFNHSCRYFEIQGNNIFVNHEYKGIFRLRANAEFTKVLAADLLKFPKKSLNSGIATFDGTIFYAAKEGVFRLRDTVFVRDTFLSQLFDKDAYTTGQMIVDDTRKWWFFTQNYMHYYTVGKLSEQFVYHSLTLPAAVTHGLPGYENLSHLGNNEYLIGTTDGYYVINPYELKMPKNKIFITQIEVAKEPPAHRYISVGTPATLQHFQNNLSFLLSIPFYHKYLHAEYQYYLEGYDATWQPWRTQSAVQYNNLPPGSYTFRAKGKVANQLTDNVAVFSFQILKPWYARRWAIAGYVALWLLLIFVINKQYTRYYAKRHEKIIAENNLLLELKDLETQKELMKYQNEKLSQDVDRKSRELAISNLNLVKKTELLKIIKEDLKKTEAASEKNDLRHIISSISNDDTDENTWHVFKEAFDQADNNFLKKMKELHPKLTPNDLRLCAYLRINLTSKEIAPLLNISVRSVEIKRYRLRKKMDLAHDQGLTEYILNV